jgi:heme exporter protein D
MKTWSEFLDMGGHGPYIWGSLLMCAAVIAIELWTLRGRRRALVSESTRNTQLGEGTAS